MALTPATLRAKAPSVLGTVSTIAGILFGVLSALYFYWAIRADNGGGYRFSRLERLGVFSSGLGALLIAARLGFPGLFPGPIPIYFVAGFILAFIVRPILDHYGFTPTKPEHGARLNDPSADGRRESGCNS
jgi:hypothetical protein